MSFQSPRDHFIFKFMAWFCMKFEIFHTASQSCCHHPQTIHTHLSDRLSAVSLILAWKPFVLPQFNMGLPLHQMQSGFRHVRQFYWWCWHEGTMIQSCLLDMSTVLAGLRNRNISCISCVWSCLSSSAVSAKSASGFTPCRPTTKTIDNFARKWLTVSTELFTALWISTDRAQVNKFLQCVYSTCCGHSLNHNCSESLF